MRTFNTLIDNNTWLGNGIEIGNKGRPMHLAQASGMYLKACCQMKDRKNIARIFDSLLGDEVFRKKNGWGLGYECDSFGKHKRDPSIPINPSDTIYGITTAICVDAIFSAYAVTLDEKMLATAKSSLDAYLNLQSSEYGYFPYSNLASERSFIVHNITASFLEPLARAYSLTSDDRYLMSAVSAFESLKNNRIEVSSLSNNNSIAWNYWENPTFSRKARLNDLIHHAYICDAFISLKNELDGNSLGRFSGLDDCLEGAIHHLDDFFFEENLSYSELPFQVSQDYKAPKSKALARAGGVFSRLRSDLKVKAIWDQIDQYEVDFCKYENNLNVRNVSPRVVSFITHMQAIVESMNVHFEQD